MKEENPFMLPWLKRRPLHCPSAFELVTRGLLKVQGLHLRVSVIP